MSDRVEWQPPRLAVAGGGSFPVRHVWCVGRNYADHAREMGADPERQPPLFFAKPASAMINAHAIDYPHETEALHHEVELVVVLGSGGRFLDPEACRQAVFGYATGIDLTRRDVQARAKQAGHPWEMSKGFDQSAPVGEVMPAGQWQPRPDRSIELHVNGHLRQHGHIGGMIWPVAELLSRLSREVTLHPGDAVMTGTPAGVGLLAVGDRVRAAIAGLPDLELTIRSPAS